MVSIIVSPTQKLGAKVLASLLAFFVVKWIFWDSKPLTPPGEIAHPAIFERLTLNSPLAGQSLDTRKYPFLQTRINRDETPDLFDNDIQAGIKDFWTRFQRPRAQSAETFHLDEEVVRGAVDELLGFNGWAAAACSSLTRPFGAQKKDDDWSDLARPGELYYFALVVHGADHFLIDQLAVIVQLSKRLGPNSVFVSLVDYASNDSTPFLCDMAEAVMILLGISFRIRQIPPMTSDPTASYYPLEEAYTRNLALEPLFELDKRRNLRFSRVIWLKGFTCPNDILETIRVSIKNEASMVCSMDWKEHNGFFIYNDRWRTRDMDGNLFRGSKSTSPIDEAPPRDPYGGARYTLHLPFQVFCCESGAHIVDPHKSYYEGITYQSSVAGVFNTSAAADGKTPKWSEGPCMDSSQLHFCRDMWMVAFRAGIKEEAHRLMVEERAGKGRKVHPFMEELIGAMQTSYGPTTSTRIGYANSGDYLADETGAGPGGGPGMDNEMGAAANAPAGGPEEGPELEEPAEAPPELPAEDAAVYDNDAGGVGRPIDLAVPFDDEYLGHAGRAVAGVVAAAGGAAADPAAAALVAAQAVAVGAGAGALVGGGAAVVGAAVGAAAVGAAAVAGVVDAAAPAQDWKVVPQPVEDKWTVVKPAPAKRGLFTSSKKVEPVVAPLVVPQRSHLEKRRPRSLPNQDFEYAVAKIIVNPRCVTTYAGVSHTQLALDLFGSGEDKEPALDEGGKYVLDEWRTPPESFVCQEMRTTGGRIAAKQQRRTGFQQSRLLLNGWRPT